MKKSFFIVWGVIVVSIVGILTYLGLVIKNNLKNYQQLESELALLSEKYVEENDFKLNDGDISIILSEDLTSDLKYKDDVCVGYVEVSVDNGYKYKAYIKCDNYETDNSSILNDKCFELETKFNTIKENSELYSVILQSKLKSHLETYEEVKTIFDNIYTGDFK